MSASKEELTKTSFVGIVIAAPNTNLTMPSPSAPSDGKKKSKQSKQKKSPSSNKSKNLTNCEKGFIVKSIDKIATLVAGVGGSDMSMVMMMMQQSQS